jgi:hypothetical protein
MDPKKLRAPWVPALIVPPEPSASLEEWQSYRAGLDALEARLLVSHPDLSWLDGLRSFKAGADAGIRSAPASPPLTSPRELPARPRWAAASACASTGAGN